MQIGVEISYLLILSRLSVRFWFVLGGEANYVKDFHVLNRILKFLRIKDEKHQELRRNLWNLISRPEQKSGEGQIPPIQTHQEIHNFIRKFTLEFIDFLFRQIKKCWNAKNLYFKARKKRKKNSITYKFFNLNWYIQYLNICRPWFLSLGSYCRTFALSSRSNNNFFVQFSHVSFVGLKIWETGWGGEGLR